MDFKRWRFVVIGVGCLIVIFLVIVESRHNRNPPSPQRLWSIELSSDPEFRKRMGIQEVVLYPPSLGFIEEDRLICAFYSHELQHFQPSGFHVLEVYAHNGGLGRRLDFDTYDEGYRAIPVADGGFVVLAADELKKFNGQFVPTSVYPTPRVKDGGYFDRWRVDVSPSGNSVLLYSHRSDDSQAELVWSHASDLSPAANLAIPRTAAFRGSDTAAIIAANDDEQLLSTGRDTMLCARCRAHFLTNDLLFLDRGDSYSIETLSGKSLGTGPLNMQALNVSRAANAPRFVYLTGHYVGSGTPLQTHFDSITGKILVVDFTANKPVAEIDINEPAGNPSAGLNQMAVALSPDGKFLALLLHQNLTLYALP